MYQCNICHEKFDTATSCPMCGSTEVETIKKPDGKRKSTPWTEFELFKEQPAEPKTAKQVALATATKSESQYVPEYPTTITLSAKEWEATTLEAIKLEEKHETMTGNRYGLDCRPMPSKKHPGDIEWTPVASLPDFEGLLMNGPQFVIENKKVASRKSLQLNEDKFKKRQLAHLFKRDKFGAISMLLVHFNPRPLKAGPTDSETFAFPVSATHPFWIINQRGGNQSLTPEDAALFGFRVPWGTKYRSRTVRPLILETVQAIRELRENGWPEMAEENVPPPLPEPEPPPW